MDTIEYRLTEIQSYLTELSKSDLNDKINHACEICIIALEKQLPVLICGNGGSAADAQHISGELVGRFLQNRKALNVKALTTDSSVITAWANDSNYETIFSRQLEAYGQKGGVLVAISTSGNSKNVLNATAKAKELGMKVVGLTGRSGGKMRSMCDVCITTPPKATPRVQEIHVIIYHFICEIIECHFINK